MINEFRVGFICGIGFTAALIAIVTIFGA